MCFFGMRPVVAFIWLLAWGGVCFETLSPSLDNFGLIAELSRHHTVATPPPLSSGLFYPFYPSLVSIQPQGRAQCDAMRSARDNCVEKPLFRDKPSEGGPKKKLPGSGPATGVKC